MLATTAARTGGLCMACKRGIRKEMDAAKIPRQQEQQQPDPFGEYWAELVHRVHQSPKGLHHLSALERPYYLVTLLQGTVCNGGMHQFFSTAYGNHYQETLEGLQILEATCCRELLITAKEVLFPNGDPPVEEIARRALLPIYPLAPDAPRPAWDLALDCTDAEFYKDRDRLDERLHHYALKHQLVSI